MAYYARQFDRDVERVLGRFKQAKELGLAIYEVHMYVKWSKNAPIHPPLPWVCSPVILSHHTPSHLIPGLPPLADPARPAPHRPRPPRPPRGLPPPTPPRPSCSCPQHYPVHRPPTTTTTTTAHGDGGVHGALHRPVRLQGAPPVVLLQGPGPPHGLSLKWRGTTRGEIQAWIGACRGRVISCGLGWVHALPPLSSSHTSTPLHAHTTSRRRPPHRRGDAGRRAHRLRHGRGHRADRGPSTSTCSSSRRGRVLRADCDRLCRHERVK